MKFLIRLFILQLLAAASVWAAGFTAHYVAPARQLWFVQPLAEKGDYRLCVTIFGPDGAPQREIVAIKATYAGGSWLIRDGWELILDHENFSVLDVNKLTGVQAEFSLNPSATSPADPRLRTLGRGTMFSDHSAPPNYVNLSVLSADPKSGVVTYVFGRQATLNIENEAATGTLSGVMIATISANSNVPVVVTAEKSEF